MEQRIATNMRTAASRNEGLQLTRDAGTESGYQSVADRLLERYAFECSGDGSEDTEAYISWCEGLSVEYAPASWRRYRAALAWAADQQGLPDVANRLRAIPCVRDPERPVRGAAKKLKGGAMPSLETLLAELQAAPLGSVRRALSDWLVATLIAGLRPTEWLDAQWISDTDGPRVVCRNLKDSNDRANGATRTIWLHRAPIEAQERVSAHIEAIHAAVLGAQARLEAAGRPADRAAAFESHMGVVRSALSRVNRKIWPRKTKVPSFYTCRHQFAANAKAYGHGFEQVAALMGHASSATAYQHYARATSGRPEQCWADPDPAEVATVRDGFASWRARKSRGPAGVTHEAPGAQ